MTRFIDKYSVFKRTRLDPKSVFVDLVKLPSKSSRRSFLTSIITICFAGLLGLAGIYVTWVGPDRLLKLTTDKHHHEDLSDSRLSYTDQCSSPLPSIHRFDCWPQFHGVTKEKCEAKGCCWLPTSLTRRADDTPWCFYPTNYSLYRVQTVLREPYGLSVFLISNQTSGWPNDINQLRVDVNYDTKTRLHFKIYDTRSYRYEVPVQLSQTDHPVTEQDTDYRVDIPSKGPFYITVTRKSTGKILFSSKSVAPLVFADQFLQFGTQLSSQYIYGLGERMDKFAISTKWNRLALFAHDEPPVGKANLYGVHTFYLNIEEDHNAHGVFFLNSNAMEIELQEAPALTYRTTGGVLDFYIFTGPSPDSVVEQYTELIGRPFIPPYWALGFHLCRWGYESSNELKKVIKRMRDAKMPCDTQWTDIDYMASHLDWTYDKDRYSGLPDIVEDLHSNGQYFIPIIDPGISNSQPNNGYFPYDSGLEKNVFIKTEDGKTPIIGRVWPGTTVFPDFFHPNATDYWTSLAKGFHDEIPFDGLWIDMNEPSDFSDGTSSLKGCPKSALEDPPFVPVGLRGGKLSWRTLCASSRQYTSTTTSTKLSTHYNLHSLYGHSEAVVTKRALNTILGNKRSIVISRSTYPTTGVHAGHWLGDNKARWDHVYYSITGVLSFQLFGIPLVGADICGFTGNTNTELCTRWMQLGAFYPFMRNHNYLLDKDQDPAVFDNKTQTIMRNALNIRYSLLPYLYTLFYRSHINGTAIVRPLFFQYPVSNKDLIYSIDEQFMWGTSILVTPVLKKGITRNPGYLPKDRWYDFFNETSTDSTGQFRIFDLPIDHIGIHVRGGSIIPMQTPNVTTFLARKNKLKLLVALSSGFTATGQLYWDDGESRDSITSGKYALVKFQASKKSISSTILIGGQTDWLPAQLLGEVKILGIVDKPKAVIVNGNSTQHFTFEKNTLVIFNQTVSILEPFLIDLV